MSTKIIRAERREWDGSHVSGYSPAGYVGAYRYCQWIVLRLAEEREKHHLMIQSRMPGKCRKHRTPLVALDAGLHQWYGCDVCFEEQIRISARLQDEFLALRTSGPSVAFLRIVRAVRPLGSKFNCFHCGRETENLNRNQRYCSGACKVAANRSHQREQLAQYRAAVWEAKAKEGG
jgi:hypothetical protein